MTPRGSLVATLGGALAAVTLAAAVLHARETSYPAPPITERLMYLTSGGVARRLALSFDGLVADVYWIRAIQHYGRDAHSSRPVGRFELLQPLLDLTTTLDPHFTIAYRFGAIFLALPASSREGSGPGRPDQAIALLEKGLRDNPGRWLFAQDAGFINYFHTGDYAEAARWFERAAAMPGAPVWLTKLAADTKLGGGDRAGARLLLERLTSSEERYIRQASERGIKQLDALDEIDRYQAAVDRFFAERHVFPFGWNELIGRIPRDPAGVPYAYDQKSHTVTMATNSPLMPLPEALSPAGRARKAK